MGIGLVGFSYVQGLHGVCVSMCVCGILLRVSCSSAGVGVYCELFSFGVNWVSLVWLRAVFVWSLFIMYVCSVF